MNAIGTRAVRQANLLGSDAPMPDGYCNAQKDIGALKPVRQIRPQQLDCPRAPSRKIIAE